MWKVLALIAAHWRGWRWRRAGVACAMAGLSGVALCAPAWAQDSSTAPSRSARSLRCGVEIALRTGHADRGFVVSDRAVIQPEVWVAVAGTELSAWSSFTLAQTTDSARPQILEFELTRELEWKRLTVGPAVTMFFYHDPVSIDRTRSIEGWLHVTYDAGPFSLVAHQSIDVLTYHGAYF